MNFIDLVNHMSDDHKRNLEKMDKKFRTITLEDARRALARGGRVFGHADKKMTPIMDHFRLDEMVHKGAELLLETGEMGQYELEEGGDWHDTAVMMAADAKELERLSMKFQVNSDVRPFDQYQGPYIATTHGRMWIATGYSNGPNVYFLQGAEMQGTIEELSAAINGDQDMITACKQAAQQAGQEDTDIDPAPAEEPIDANQFPDVAQDADESKGNRTTGAQRYNARMDKIWAHAKASGALSDENLAKARKGNEELRNKKNESKINEDMYTDLVKPFDTNEAAEKSFLNVTGKYDALAWPGMYPLYYMTADGNVLCPGCANDNKALTQDVNDKQWNIVGQEANYENDDATCAHCNQKIESAYGSGKDVDIPESKTINEKRIQERDMLYAQQMTDMLVRQGKPDDAIRKILAPAMTETEITMAIELARKHYKVKDKSVDRGQPESGKQYSLTGGADKPSIARGDSWQDSEVKNESNVNESDETIEASFGPGTYFVGDICYALDDQIYDKFWGDENDYDDGAYNYKDSSFVVARTAYGDGGYRGTDGTEYGVDAGVIGIVPQQLWKKNKEDMSLNGGKVVTVKRALRFSASGGVFEISVDGKGFTIDTMGNDDGFNEDDEDADEAIKENRVSKGTWHLKERAWKYILAFGFMKKYQDMDTMSDEDVKVATDLAKTEISKLMKLVTPDVKDQLQDCLDEFEMVSTSDEYNDAMSLLYDVADGYSIWVDQDFGKPTGRNVEKRPGMKESNLDLPVEEQLRAIAKKNHVGEHQIEIYVKFMQDRFPHADYQYAAEWAERFAKGTAWNRADSQSRRALTNAGLIGECVIDENQFDKIASYMQRMGSDRKIEEFAAKKAGFPDDWEEQLYAAQDKEGVRLYGRKRWSGANMGWMVDEITHTVASKVYGSNPAVLSSTMLPDGTIEHSEDDYDMDESLYESMKRVKLPESKKDDEITTNKKKLASILRKIHKATDENDIDTALDMLMKHYVTKDANVEAVKLIQAEAERKRTRLSKGDKEETPEAETDAMIDKEVTEATDDDEDDDEGPAEGDSDTGGTDPDIDPDLDVEPELGNGGEEIKEPNPNAIDPDAAAVDAMNADQDLQEVEKQIKVGSRVKVGDKEAIVAEIKDGQYKLMSVDARQIMYNDAKDNQWYGADELGEVVLESKIKEGFQDIADAIDDFHEWCTRRGVHGPGVDDVIEFLDVSPEYGGADQAFKNKLIHELEMSLGESKVNEMPVSKQGVGRIARGAGIGKKDYSYELTSIEPRTKKIGQRLKAALNKSGKYKGTWAIDNDLVTPDDMDLGERINHLMEKHGLAQKHMPLEKVLEFAKGSKEELKANAKNWVADRLDNEEPLMFNEFVRFMGDIGHSRIDAANMKRQMQAEYMDGKASIKDAPIPYNKSKWQSESKVNEASNTFLYLEMRDSVDELFAMDILDETSALDLMKMGLALDEQGLNPEKVESMSKAMQQECEELFNNGILDEESAYDLLDVLKRLGFKYMKEANDPHSKDKHCTSCKCDKTAKDTNKDPEAKDKHCGTCACESVNEMGMRDMQLAQKFINTELTSGKGEHTKVEGNILYSYETPVAIKLGREDVIVDDTKYSHTTTILQNNLINAGAKQVSHGEFMQHASELGLAGAGRLKENDEDDMIMGVLPTKVWVKGRPDQVKDRPLGDGNWREGTCGTYKFQAKVYDEPSEYGIRDGRVSKLNVIDKEGEVLVDYDRGWITGGSKSKVWGPIVKHYDNAHAAKELAAANAEMSAEFDKPKAEGEFRKQIKKAAKIKESGEEVNPEALAKYEAVLAHARQLIEDGITGDEFDENVAEKFGGTIEQTGGHVMVGYIPVDADHYISITDESVGLEVRANDPEAAKLDLMTTEGMLDNQYLGGGENVARNAYIYPGADEELKRLDASESKVNEVKFECIECGKKFNGAVPSSGEKKCPGCGGYDVEIAETKKRQLHRNIKEASEVRCRYCGRPSEDRSGVCNACDKTYEGNESKLVEGIYQEMLASGIPIDNHESDLYVKVTPESEAIVKKYGKDIAVSRFVHQVDKTQWFDIPFAFEPWWSKRVGNSESAIPGGDNSFIGLVNTLNQVRLKENEMDDAYAELRAHNEKMVEVGRLSGYEPEIGGGGAMVWFIKVAPNKELTFGFANGPLGYDLIMYDDVNDQGELEYNGAPPIDSGEMDKEDASAEEMAEFIKSTVEKYKNQVDDESKTMGPEDMLPPDQIGKVPERVVPTRKAKAAHIKARIAAKKKADAKEEKEMRREEKEMERETKAEARAEAKAKESVESPIITALTEKYGIGE